MLKPQILAAAIRLAKERGYRRVRRDDVAKAAQCGTGTVNFHFDNIETLRQAILAHAIENEVVEIIAEAMIYRDPIVASIPDALKKKAARALSSTS